jgi:hypothetical protein
VTRPGNPYGAPAPAHLAARRPGAEGDTSADVREALATAARAEASQRQRAPGAPGDRAEADPGEVFVALQRDDGTELRVSLHWYDPAARKGPWVRLAPWRDGWPVRGKGASLRLREVAAVTVALGRILAAVEGNAGRALAAPRATADAPPPPDAPTAPAPAAPPVRYPAPLRSDAPPSPAAPSIARYPAPRRGPRW